ncbi:MAG TPA: hypothetical protein VJC13_02935 [Candidatus Paceibacterota bacterium]|nr:hypothetical protein [uncultured archaeon]
MIDIILFVAFGVCLVVGLVVAALLHMVLGSFVLSGIVGIIMAGVVFLAMIWNKPIFYGVD